MSDEKLIAENARLKAHIKQVEAASRRDDVRVARARKAANAAIVAMRQQLAEALGTVPPLVRGDGPCADCGTLNNIVWFTDNVFWNAVTGESVVYADRTGAVLCVGCFVTRAEAIFHPTGWRLIPEFSWTKVSLDAQRVEQVSSEPLLALPAGREQAELPE